MSLLLDTHVVIWAMEQNPRLSPVAVAAYSDGTQSCFVSIASLWEMAIKASLGKLTLPASWSDELLQHLTENAIEILPISPAHCTRVEHLTMHHRDPFDRMLIAQAMHEQLSIISADTALDSYPIQRIW